MKICIQQSKKVKMNDDRLFVLIAMTISTTTRDESCRFKLILLIHIKNNRSLMPAQPQKKRKTYTTQFIRD
ncbi:MAG: hypothetical protein ACI8RD_009311 [Bacillariaceae sp.]|jgi:hypothetical protein